MIALVLLALTVSLSADPELPAPNLLTDAKFRFENGLKGWNNAHSNEVKCVETEGRGLSRAHGRGPGRIEAVTAR